MIDEGSIIGAARKLGLTSGAVALRIKVVEREIGAALIGRVGRKVAPTIAAHRLIQPLRELLVSVATIKHLGVDDGAIVGKLRLGAISTATTGLVPQLLRSLVTTNPNFEVFVEPGTSIELYDRVLDGALDAAIVVEPPFALRKGEMFTRWLSEPLVLIAPIELADTDSLSLLRTQAFIRYDRRNWGGRIVDDYLKRTGLQPRDRYELDALDAIVAMVSAGLGVAIIPDWTGPHPEGTPVIRRPLPPPSATRNIGLYRRSMSARQDLLDIVERAFRTNGAIVRPPQSL